ncbi:MAG: ABC transporter ATP-binding protein, partial [Verrucomicrobia bacterium]|nr:ABC transporter ATP-binding protein [Verrucomicrobiota bacterium]
MSAANNHHESVRVEARELRKSFSGQEVLRGVSFNVERGEIF